VCPKENEKQVLQTKGFILKIKLETTLKDSNFSGQHLADFQKHIVMA